jgi:hypothetical protein
MQLDKMRNLHAEVQDGVPTGMTVGDVGVGPDDGESEGVNGEGADPRKVPERKTKKQRAKTAKLREEACLSLVVFVIELICPRRNVLSQRKLRKSGSLRRSVRSAPHELLWMAHARQT